MQCSLCPTPLPTTTKPTRKLTLVVGKLQVVIHGGHELLHKVAAHIGGQVRLTVHLALQGFCKEICGVGSTPRWVGEELVVTKK